MSGKFKYKGRAEILHLNTRKEGDDDELYLAADVKFFIKQVPLAGVLCFDEMLGDFCFLPGGAVRNVRIGPLHITGLMRHYSLTIGGRITNTGVDVKKLSIEPHDGGVFSVSLTASIQPTADEVAILAEYLKDEVDIDLAPTDGELDLEKPNAN